MTENEITWLKEVFDRHVKNQQTYLDEKFSNLENRVKEVKDIAEDLRENREDDIKDCADCRLCLETKIHNVEEESKDRDVKIDKKVLVLTIIGTGTLFALGYGVYGGVFANFIGKILASFIVIG